MKTPQNSLLFSRKVSLTRCRAGSSPMTHRRGDLSISDGRTVVSPCGVACQGGGVARRSGRARTADDVVLWWCVEGDSHPVVLLPGRGDSSDLFPAEFTDALVDAGSSVIRLDPRDTGRSDDGGDTYRLSDLADDVITVCDAADVERVDLVAVSMGGMIAVDLAVRYPTRVRAVVFLAAMSPDPTAGIGDAFFDGIDADPAVGTLAAMGSTDVGRRGMGRSPAGCSASTCSGPSRRRRTTPARGVQIGLARARRPPADRCASARHPRDRRSGAARRSRQRPRRWHRQLRAARHRRHGSPADKGGMDPHRRRSERLLPRRLMMLRSLASATTCTSLRRRAR